MQPRATKDPPDTVLRPLSILSSLAIAANRGRTLAGAMPEILSVLCEGGGWSLGHAYRLVIPGDRAFPLSTWWPSAPTFEAFRAATAETSIRSRGLATRLRDAQGPVWLEDVAETDWFLRREAASESGLRSLLAFPVVGPDGMTAFIELMSPERRPPEEDQLELARHAGIILGQVLERESVERRFRVVFDRLPTPVGLARWSDRRLVEVNEAFAQIVGSEPRGLRGVSLDDLGVAVPEGPTIDGYLDVTPIRLSASELLDPRLELLATTSPIRWEGEDHLLVTLMDVTRLSAALDEAEEARARVRSLTARILELQEEERESLSRELHDQVGQQLTAVRIVLGRLGRTGADEQLVDEGVSIADDLLEKVRTLSFELRPQMLDQLGLRAAIEAYVERQAEAAGIRWRASKGEGSLPLDRSQQTALFRIVQEAVTNVVRHAQAMEVVIELRIGSSFVELTVEDDGVGFEVNRQDRVLGLAIMRERAGDAGAVLKVTSEPGRGTTVRVRCRVRDGA